jgi:hypothetical protein
LSASGREKQKVVPSAKAAAALLPTIPKRSKATIKSVGCKILQETAADDQHAQHEQSAKTVMLGIESDRDFEQVNDEQLEPLGQLLVNVQA